jgi:hypothetical protein
MDDVEVLEPAIRTEDLYTLEMYITAYFEGKGLEAYTRVYVKKNKYVGIKYYLYEVELRIEYDKREGKYIYPYVEKKDIENIKEKASTLGLNLIDYSIETSRLVEDELVFKLYFHPQK